MLMIHLAATVLALQAAKAAPPAAAAVAATDVAVAISYTGKGTVDANHKVLTWLFADPNVTANSRPVGAAQSLDKKTGTITFKNAPSTPVYVFTCYDEKGGYDGVSGPPPPGIPCTIYKKTAAGAATPVKAGGPVVKFAFGDSDRWK